jgi:chemotaxis protein histidine kinase CheA
MPATELLDELRSIQALLGTGAGRPRPETANPASRAALQHASEEEEDAPKAQKSAQVQELERTVASLRHKCQARDEKRSELEAALAAARRDGEVAVRRLQGELSSKQEECGQLASMILQQQQELEALHSNLHHNAQQAEESGKATTASILQLQQAAAEWRRQSEDGLEALAAERRRSAALHQQMQALQAEVAEQRQGRQLAEAELAKLRAAMEGSAGDQASLVAELRRRLSLERSWRKAVSRWLRGEVHTRGELERVLLNVGAAVRCGPGEQPLGCPEGRSCWGQQLAAAPALPPRRMAGAQQVPDATVHVEDTPLANDGAGGIRVTVRSPRAHTISVSSTVEASSGSPGHVHGGSTAKAAPNTSWRQHFQATMKAFDERNSHLQRALSSMRHEAR